MDTNIAHKIARAFVHGLAFSKGLSTLAQDAKAKMEEGDKWITIGAEPGDDGKKHGGRHVLISGTGEVKKGLSKSAQGKPLGEAIKELKDKAESKKAESKKAESKKSETKTKTKKSETPRAGLLTEQGSSLAQLAEREYDKVITAIKNDVGSINTDPTFPAEIKKYEAVQLKSILRVLKIKLSDAHNDLSIIKDMVSKAVKDGNLNQQGVSSVWLAIKRLKDRAAYVVSHTNSETAGSGRNNTRGMKETAETLGSLSNEASGIRHDANRLKEEVRGSIAQFEQENANTPETKKAESKKSNLSPEDRQALRKLKTDNTKALKSLDNLKSSLSAENIARRKYHLSKPDAEIVQDTRQKIDQLKPLSAKLIKQVTANVADGLYSIDAAQEILASANQTIRQIRNIGSHMYAASMHGYGAPNAMEEDYRLIRGLYTQLDKAAQQGAESDRVDAMYAQKGGKPKNRIIN